MSPEQCLGEDDLTPASDQYALGIVLFQMITGNLPFWSSNPLALLQKHVNDTPPSPSTARPDLPKGAEQVIMKALAKKPQDRFPNCIALAESFNYSLGFNRLVDRFGSELGDRIDNALGKVQRKGKRSNQE
jgi:serine/threonine-protein kinase